MAEMRIDVLRDRVAELEAALTWIADIADKNYEQDDTLRSRGARTLIRISDHAEAAVKGGKN